LREKGRANGTEEKADRAGGSKKNSYTGLRGARGVWGNTDPADASWGYLKGGGGPFRASVWKLCWNPKKKGPGHEMIWKPEVEKRLQHCEKNQKKNLEEKITKKNHVDPFAARGEKDPWERGGCQ